MSAFAHKAGLHASAIKVDPDLYQHRPPESVGNDMRMLVSDMAGRASIELKGRELGFDLADDRELVSRVTDRVKELESAGYTFEAADASFELLLAEEARRAAGSSTSSPGGSSSSRRRRQACRARRRSSCGPGASGSRHRLRATAR